MKIFLINILFVVSLFAGTYDDAYSVVDNKNIENSQEVDSFMYGRFLEIIRFDRLDFSDGDLSSNSQDYLDEISKTIIDSIDNKEDIKVKIIGHSSEDSGNLEEAIEISKEFALEIEKRLVEKGISKDIITTEFRGDKDKLFTSKTDEGMRLSNRVMVTMYKIAPKEIDSDKDGISNSLDRCENTPTDVKVDENGCPYDSDKDGILDYEDKCMDSFSGASVDKNGCELDSDSDGVLDHKDLCSDTIVGFSVDAQGCPISTELQLTFERLSSKIKKESYSQIIEFAQFMNTNQEYKIQIIGHTDSVGKAAQNMKLSFDRAHSVKSALVNEGIDEKRIEASGRGELDPTQTNRKADGRASNRRIEVKLFK